ncbi:MULTISPECIES: radical SAM protein [Aerosakkonema]|uniref:radical SAM protein n=1 Tax=Aerosakkonema TaxID=1246629 RepID=UPI0035B9B839
MQSVISLATQKKAPRIGLVELPVLKLVDPNGINRNLSEQYEPLLSKQVLLAHLQAGGFDAQLVNLRAGDYEEEYGSVTWKGINLSKRYLGTNITSLDPQAYDAWGITNNYMQYRELAFKTIRHLVRGGKPVVVGGSDPIAEPQVYLEAGATAVVIDKSGAANWPIFDYVLKQPMREPLSGVILSDGTRYPLRLPPMSPEDWPLPSLEVVKQCFGLEFWSKEDNWLLPIGSVFPDLGCDRKCDFCQTPTYGTGYRRMSPSRALKWFELQKEAGAKSVICHSDQFLGRVLFKDGRQEVLDIMKGVREMELPIIWGNGLELKKATLGRGYERTSEDLIPDYELIEALWGWDGKAGCYYAFIPAERPVFGREGYAKLLPWQQHREMMRAIVRAGVPKIVYGLVLGLPDDSNESMLRLEEALTELCQELKTINPALSFWILTSSIAPIPGTPQGQNIRNSGLLRFEDPTIFGTMGMACADTQYMSYEEVADWQFRLKRAGDGFWVKNLVSLEKS